MLDLEGRVRQFLSAANLPALRYIGVQVVGDSVVLSGCVRTFHEKQMATEFARRVANASGCLVTGAFRRHEDNRCPGERLPLLSHRAYHRIGRRPPSA